MLRGSRFPPGFVVSCTDETRHDINSDEKRQARYENEKQDLQTLAHLSRPRKHARGRERVDSFESEMGETLESKRERERE